MNQNSIIIIKETKPSPPTTRAPSVPTKDNICVSDGDFSSHRREEVDKEIDSLLVYTKSVKWPTLLESISEKRVFIRISQFCFALAAFLNMGYTALVNNYTSKVLDSSGIPFFCFVSISSLFVSISNLFLYLFPGFLGIPPHRHFRISKVEMVFDFIMALLWIGAVSKLAIFSICPKQTLGFINSIVVYIDEGSR